MTPCRSRIGARPPRREIPVNQRRQQQHRQGRFFEAESCRIGQRRQRQHAPPPACDPGGIGGQAQQQQRRRRRVVEGRRNPTHRLAMSGMNDKEQCRRPRDGHCKADASKEKENRGTGEEMVQNRQRVPRLCVQFKPLIVQKILRIKERAVVIRLEDAALARQGQNVLLPEFGKTRPMSNERVVLHLLVVVPDEFVRQRRRIDRTRQQQQRPVGGPRERP